MKHLLILALLLLSCSSEGKKEEGEKGDSDIAYTQGSVVSAHPLASEVGLSILKAGGNAYDAAVGTQFALAVVLPIAGNIGGGGFAIIREYSGKTAALDFRETAPGRSHKDMYLDENDEVIPNASTLGALSAGVPGSVDGMVQLHERYGSLPWKDLIEPAINLAEQGFPITKKQASALNRAQVKLKAQNKEGCPLIPAEEWKEGDMLVQHGLAMTLTRISKNGRAGFYSGKTAEHLIKTMDTHLGLISQADLDSCESIWRVPVSGNYRGYRVISMCPPSSGGVALLQLLEGSENYPLSDMGFGSAEAIHTMTELERRVYADRAIHLGDPDFYEVPLEMLLDTVYMDERINDINSGKASLSSEVSASDFIPVESPQTTHFSIVDKERNAIAITTTLNGAYGSHLMVKGAGFLLNNEMDDFSAKPGTPNMYGLIGAEANSIAPGKRMLSSMTPTILEKDDELFMVIGTPGGSTIITSVYQCVLNVLEHGMTMQEAVDAPRVHHQWLPDQIFFEEGGMDSTNYTKLMEMGHQLMARGPIGRVDAILVDEMGVLDPAADPRGDDAAASY